MSVLAGFQDWKRVREQLNPVLPFMVNQPEQDVDVLEPPVTKPRGAMGKRTMAPSKEYERWPERTVQTPVAPETPPEEKELSHQERVMAALGIKPRINEERLKSHKNTARAQLLTEGLRTVVGGIFGAKGADIAPERSYSGDSLGRYQQMLDQHDQELVRHEQNKLQATLRGLEMDEKARLTREGYDHQGNLVEARKVANMEMEDHKQENRVVLQEMRDNIGVLRRDSIERVASMRRGGTSGVASAERARLSTQQYNDKIKLEQDFADAASYFEDLEMADIPEGIRPFLLDGKNPSDAQKRQIIGERNKHKLRKIKSDYGGQGGLNQAL